MSQKLRKIRGFWDILVVVLRRKYPCRKSPPVRGGDSAIFVRIVPWYTDANSDTKIFYIRSKKR